MESKEFQSQKYKFKTYIRTLLEFDIQIQKEYQSAKEQKFVIISNGYLIDKKCFDDLKDKLFYSDFKPYINDSPKFSDKFKEKFGNIKDIAYIPCEQIIFNNSKELIDSLLKGKEYIIINDPVWKIFNNGKYKENEGKIVYQINENIMIINIDGDTSSFRHNLNIINKNCLVSRLGESRWRW